jgi:hypothetical protein
MDCGDSPAAQWSLAHTGVRTIVANGDTVPTVAAVRLCELSGMVRNDFPNDKMPYELHMLRVSMAIRDEFINLDELCGHKTAVQPVLRTRCHRLFSVAMTRSVMA